MAMSSRQIILDTETTGLEVENDRIIEFAGIESIDKKLTGRELHLYFNPEMPINPESIKIHGITDDYVKDMPTFKEKAQEIIDFLTDAQLVIHNASFDMKFLNMEFERAGFPRLEEFINPVVIDTINIAKAIFSRNMSLDKLCDHYKIDRTKRVKHGALIDCELLFEVWVKLTQRQTTLEFGGAQQVGRAADVDASQARLFVKRASEEELKAHEEYLDEMESSSKTESIFRSSEHGDGQGGEG